jgi:hypothetical protein
VAYALPTDFCKFTCAIDGFTTVRAKSRVVGYSSYEMAGEFEEGFVDVGSALPADAQTSEAGEPREALSTIQGMAPSPVPWRAMAGTMPRVRT